MTNTILAECKANVRVYEIDIEGIKLTLGIPYYVDPPSEADGVFGHGLEIYHIEIDGNEFVPAKNVMDSSLHVLDDKLEKIVRRALGIGGSK